MTLDVSGLHSTWRTSVGEILTLRWVVCITGCGRGISYVSGPTFINSNSAKLHK